MRLWLTVAGMGLITFAIRVGLFVRPERTALPPRLQHALRYVPTAVLSAIIAPEMLQPGGVLDLSPGNARLLAGLVAMLVAWRTRSVLWTIGLGMAALWALQLILR